MLNKYPLWKYLLILAVLAVGLVYSIPNLYPDDPAVQISGASSALSIEQADLDRAGKALQDAGIAVKDIGLDERGRTGLIRLTKQDDQLPAKDVVRRALGDDYVVHLDEESAVLRNYENKTLHYPQPRTANGRELPMVGARALREEAAEAFAACGDSVPDRDGYAAWGNSCGGEADDL